MFVLEYLSHQLGLLKHQLMKLSQKATTYSQMRRLQTTLCLRAIA